ncbi:hypothetical protein SAMN05192559_11422 [Halobacillus karajensis]|uniref:DUF2332 domain-containing protein n=1 Tax=Halobacillus karajensis TaxID=195088 RepID=A0A024P7X7_9BACI|nr:DUF2332 domain-containing protein [Halobacillus karajensis]CDQ20289.1 hypothetical protein BN982_02612 [Halobacillus karajensis]CDQ25050.1 hypothetical protein BN983_03355 [Halobacillus karajensis]CDQ28589.1 hypothetical protein BN981_02897 [Halobacillus karajensis]SEI11883.1 hypothetical protein SAMN05192559_11422 [Halobacillus karajensis]
MNKERTARKFSDFAVLECEGSSELYKHLSFHMAKDEELLDICCDAGESQPIPNLFLGAVHYLLIQGKDHRLKQFYPSVSDNERSMDQGLFRTFKDFCLTYKGEIKQILHTKRVQTNEVRRCAYLYPLFCHLYQKTKKPLSLIEIGTSAGLQLLWDRYSYSYGDNQLYGRKVASVHLSSHIRKGTMPPADLLQEVPIVQERVGIDLHISDVTKKADYLWLKSLIWPEHKERLATFEAAVKQLRLTPPPLIEGDGVTMLSNVVQSFSSDTVVCIYHTHVANQMTPEKKREFIQNVNAIGDYRDVCHLYNQMEDRKLHMDLYRDGKVEKRTIGETDGHGRWFDWLL